MSWRYRFLPKAIKETDHQHPLWEVKFQERLHQLVEVIEVKYDNPLQDSEYTDPEIIEDGTEFDNEIHQEQLLRYYNEVIMFKEKGETWDLSIDNEIVKGTRLTIDDLNTYFIDCQEYKHKVQGLAPVKNPVPRPISITYIRSPDQLAKLIPPERSCQEQFIKPSILPKNHSLWKPEFQKMMCDILSQHLEQDFHKQFKSINNSYFVLRDLCVELAQYISDETQSPCDPLTLSEKDLRLYLAEMLRLTYFPRMFPIPQDPDWGSRTIDWLIEHEEYVKPRPPGQILWMPEIESEFENELSDGSF